MKQKAVILNPKDNVATALADLKARETLELKIGEKNLVVKLTAPVPSRADDRRREYEYGDVIY